MAMVFCRGCAKQIHETAPSCPQCGALQHLQAPILPANPPSPWMGIVSLTLGILCTLSLFDSAEWDSDTLLGLGLFAMVSLVLGSISILQQKPGSNMGIAGVVMSGISLFVYIGLSVN
jgi:hypothetical protein